MESFKIFFENKKSLCKVCGAEITWQQENGKWQAYKEGEKHSHSYVEFQGARKKAFHKKQYAKQKEKKEYIKNKKQVEFNESQKRFPVGSYVKDKDFNPIGLVVQHTSKPLVDSRGTVTYIEGDDEVQYRNGLLIKPFKKGLRIGNFDWNPVIASPDTKERFHQAINRWVNAPINYRKSLEDIGLNLDVVDLSLIEKKPVNFNL